MQKEIWKTSFILLCYMFVTLSVSGMAHAQTVRLPRTGQNTSYYPGDDGDLKIGISWPSRRFTAHGNGTMTDNLTGLMWTKNANLPGTGLTWGQALLHVDFMNQGDRPNCGYNDWRLPNINELESLLNGGQEFSSQEWLQSQGFKNVMGDYWSSTLSAPPSETNYPAFIVYYDDIAGANIMSERYLWPVRGVSSGPARLWKTGQTASYSELDDGDLQKGVAWPDPRFVDHANGTVTDKLTGLMWLKDADCFGGMAWQDALDAITDFNANQGDYSCVSNDSSYTDWRLPNRKELRSLIDYSKHEPALPENHPLVNVRFSYWSSTSSYPEYAWLVGIGWGGMTDEPKSFPSYVWPVRGGIPLKLLAPNGGETLPSGSTYRIRWEGLSDVGRFKVLYSVDNGITWILIDDNITGMDYLWQVPPPSGNKNKCLVKVIGYDATDKRIGSDRSDHPFAVTVLRLTSPNGREDLISDHTYSITWETNATKRDVSSVRLLYTKKGGRTWIPITTCDGNPGIYSWTIPKTYEKKTNCRVKVVLRDGKGNSLGSDTSDLNFTIWP